MAEFAGFQEGVLTTLSVEIERVVNVPNEESGGHPELSDDGILDESDYGSDEPVEESFEEKTKFSGSSSLRVLEEKVTLGKDHIPVHFKLEMEGSSGKAGISLVMYALEEEDEFSIVGVSLPGQQTVAMPDPIVLIRRPLKKGVTWKSSTTITKEVVETDVKITVSAGSFEGCYVIHSIDYKSVDSFGIMGQGDSLEGTEESDDWFCPNVGCVKVVSKFKTHDGDYYTWIEEMTSRSHEDVLTVADVSGSSSGVSNLPSSTEKTDGQTLTQKFQDGLAIGACSPFSANSKDGFKKALVRGLKFDCTIIKGLGAWSFVLGSVLIGFAILAVMLRRGIFGRRTILEEDLDD